MKLFKWPIETDQSKRYKEMEETVYFVGDQYLKALDLISWLVTQPEFPDSLRDRVCETVAELKRNKVKV